MNLLFVTPDLDVGGAQSFLLRLVSSLAPTNNIHLYNIHPKNVNDKFYKALLSDDVVLHHSKSELIEQRIEHFAPKPISKLLLKVKHKLFPRSKSDTLQILKILKEHKITHINSHMYLADFFVSDLKKELPAYIKWVSTFHGCYNLILEKNKSIEIRKNIFDIISATDGVITVADKHSWVFTETNITNAHYKKIYNGFIPHEYNKIDLRKHYSIKDSALIYGMVARGAETKGWEPAIKAFLNLQERGHEDNYLILVGESKHLLDLKKKYNQHKNIVFYGGTEKPLREISNFDVGLLPTTFPAESLPNSVTEYLYQGKPVIATNWAEIPLMIESENGVGGILVNVTNNQVNMEELANAMHQYYENRTLLKEHEHNAKKAFKKFEMKLCMDQYLSFFNKV